MLTFDESSHSYTLSGKSIPSVTQLIAPLSDYSDIPPAILARAAAYGTAVHTMCILELAGLLDYGTLDDGLYPALESFFLWKSCYPQIADSLKGGTYNPEDGSYIGDGFACEKKMAHAKLGYAGTPDIIIDGSMIIDIKTRKPNPLTDGIQCEGYEKLWIANGGKKGNYEHRILFLDREYKCGESWFQFEKVNNKENVGRFRLLLDHHYNQQNINSWRNK